MFAKKKICFIVATPLTAKVFLPKHFEYLSKYYEIHLVANFDQAPNLLTDIPFVDETKNIAIYRGISVFNDMKALIEILKYFSKNKFDAIHTVTPKAGLIGILGGFLTRVKIRTHIFTGQIWHTKTGFLKFILKNIDRLIVLLSTDILVDGESQRQFLIRNKICKAYNSQVLGKGSISGVDSNKFIPNIELYKKFREELNIKNEIVFLFLGRLNYDKGILDLVVAFVKLNSLYSNVKLILVGPDEENMTSKIKEITLNKNIILLGATNKPEEILQMADVFCLPSYREGFGTSVIEASLLEKPVICSDTYGLMETIIEEETGLRHKVADANSIFKQMERLLDGDLRVSLGKKGRQYVLDNFSANTISEKWLEYYRTKIS
jgi:glycosyltransferase involved in cell wall biosynthesis